MNKSRSIIVIGASSGIGTVLINRWSEYGWKIFGTYRTKSPETYKIINGGANLVPCNVSNLKSINSACNKLKKLCPAWDILVVCLASLMPIGSFSQSNMKDWENSIRINFTNQMRIIHKLLPTKRKNSVPEPCVLFFSGGGINDAPTNYSAYIISKMALIKMCELLDAEIHNVRFVTVGPGWINTKIHDQTLKAKSKAGANYQRTIEKLKTGDLTPIDRLLDCCDWIINAPRNIVGGRNFNVMHDKWGNKNLIKKLTKNPHLLKLRKYGTVAK